MNPFLITGYLSPKYFCDRQSETKRLTESILNQRDVTLFSRRRIGKTALIHHTFYRLKKKKKISLFYIDLYSTNNLKDFTEALGKAVLGEFDSGLKKLADTLKNLFGNLRPHISYDNFTGSPVLSFDWLTDKQAETTLENIFEYLKQQSTHVVIAFDEFQQILNYPQKNIEALLRSLIQNAPNISCIYSGSRDHLITSMFKDKSRPFYQSGELFYLEKIDPKAYKKFIALMFSSADKIITDESIDKILQLCEYNTYFVQYLCNRLYSLDYRTIIEERINETVLQILMENEPYFLNYRNLLTKNQWILISAIAKENGIKQITSKDFINKYLLNTPSSVKAALDVLILKGLVNLSDRKYEVEDIFFKIWLQRN